MEHTLTQDMPRHEDQPRTRVSILGNNGKDCTSTDSRIYFGAGGYHDGNRTCEGVVEFQIEMIFITQNLVVKRNGLADYNSEMNKPRSCPDSCTVPNIHFRALTD